VIGDGVVIGDAVRAMSTLVNGDPGPYMKR